MPGSYLPVPVIHVHDCVFQRKVVAVHMDVRATCATNTMFIASGHNDIWVNDEHELGYIAHVC